MNNSATRDTSYSTKGKRRNIRFCASNDTLFVRSHTDMSDEEKAATWYTDQDKKNMRISLMKTIKSMQKNGLACERCTRGLEHMRTPEHLEQRQINKECNISAVLEEQQRQRSLGIDDPAEMRRISEASSQWSKNMALKSSEADAIKARALQKDLCLLMAS
mmetsp:Transcript_18211/g.25065  ORF Transcript_18211/g.25065 Transcript_18211/m.25065 type:complete len:161 (-) Transcript_18211:150-632(-)